MNIKRANAIGVALALVIKRFAFVCLYIFLILVLYISNHLSASTRHITHEKIVLLPQSKNMWK